MDKVFYIQQFILNDQQKPRNVFYRLIIYFETILVLPTKGQKLFFIFKNFCEFLSVHTMNHNMSNFFSELFFARALTSIVIEFFFFLSL